MKLRFAWTASALLVWMGCGGAFTTIDPGAEGGAGSDTTTGGAGTASTGTGSTGVGGSGSGVGGSSTGPGGFTTGAGGVTTGAGGGNAGSAGSVGTGGSGGGSGPDWNACNGPGQCVALEKSCCGSCGTAELSAYVGVNTKRVQDFNQATCPGDYLCPAIACAQAINPNIAARCVAGQCQAFDVRKVPEYSACGGDSDCHLRMGLGCCTCGVGTTGWVAVSKSGEQGIATAECSPNAACPECAAIPPPMTIAACTNHVCQVLLTP